MVIGTMGASIIQEQHDVIVQTIKGITRGDWKVLVVDEGAKKIIDNVASEDDILNLNVANIEYIEKKRDKNPEMDAIYFLTPQPHVVDCLMADFEHGRHRRAFLVWTAMLDPQLRRRIDQSPVAKRMIAAYETLTVDFFPRESHLVSFRDPWSFPILYHPSCNNFVREHMQALAQKITAVCVTLGEYPKVRYYRPKNPTHEASVLCSHLARFVQEELDTYAQWNKDFPPQTSRPQATLVITDRCMDLVAPLVHEFTYQAMAHDLLPIREGEKVMYRTITNKGKPDEEEIDYELTDKDKVWVDNRHQHMKDTIEKLMQDFKKFLEANPHFVNEAQATSLNALRQMMGGMKEFAEMRQAYSLHMTMAQDAMNLFQANNLPEIASVEQSLATGMDEDGRRPKDSLEQVVRLLDNESVTPPDRLRLIILWILYRDGVIPEDINKLLSHAQLRPDDAVTIANLELIGGHVLRQALKEQRPTPSPLFPKTPKDVQRGEEYSLSRFEPALQSLLQELSQGTLDQTVFPYTRPPMDPNEELLAAQQGSLRAGRPNWAAAGRRPPENRQRIIVFMAGGATFSESRVCYDVGNMKGKDIFLATSHMITPQLYIRQVGDLSKDRRRLDLPIERPKPRAPDWVRERPGPPPQAAPAATTSSQGHGRHTPSSGGLPGRPAAPPTAQMGNMSLGGSHAPHQHRPSNGGMEDRPTPSTTPQPPAHAHAHAHVDHGKLHKEKEKEKKKRNFLGMKR